MIFGNAPIILPAITGLRLNYTPVFYGHLILLHTTLVYRMYGNLAQDFTAQQWSGLFNIIAMLLFLAVTIFVVFRSNPSQLVDHGNQQHMNSL